MNDNSVIALNPGSACYEYNCHSMKSHLRKILNFVLIISYFSVSKNYRERGERDLLFAVTFRGNKCSQTVKIKVYLETTKEECVNRNEAAVFTFRMGKPVLISCSVRQGSGLVTGPAVRGVVGT